MLLLQEQCMLHGEGSAVAAHTEQLHSKKQQSSGALVMAELEGRHMHDCLAELVEFTLRKPTFHLLFSRSGTPGRTKMLLHLMRGKGEGEPSSLM